MSHLLKAEILSKRNNSNPERRLNTTGSRPQDSLNRPSGNPPNAFKAVQAETSKAISMSVHI